MKLKIKKKINKLLTVFAILCTILVPNCSAKAASGKAMVHYRDTERQDTYKYTKQHMESIGFSVEGHMNWDNQKILNHLDTYNILVIHSHGNKGYITMLDTYLVGKNGNGGTIKAVNTMPSDSASQLKMAIYYGCQTGNTTTNFGNLPQETVNKGAQAAVAWTVDLKTAHVPIWNRLFFEKAKNDTIVEGYRHADYWLSEIKGADASSRMKNRTEAGNINGYIYK